MEQGRRSPNFPALCLRSRLSFVVDSIFRRSTPHRRRRQQFTRLQSRKVDKKTLLGIACFLSELFGLSDESSHFVYLSDGGHFDNMGLYELVRHPLYASELVAMLGFVIANPSIWNIALWVSDSALLFARACAEERFLSADPVYSQYRRRVRYRLIPRVI